MTDSVILVTGASGFIASHVTKQLLEAGYQVRATVRDSKNELKVKPLLDLCKNAKYPLELVEADLLKADSWSKAVEGCKYVMHIASPYPLSNPKKAEDVVKPAVEGTLNVLKACAEAKTVKRVVLTSSIFAVGVANIKEDNSFSEEDFLTVENISNFYGRSKILAERAAWKFVEEMPEGERFELAVVNPSAVMGPVFHGTYGSSMDIIRQLMERAMPFLVQIALSICDVRDVAEAHIKCMTLPEAAGKRHIIASESKWLKEIAHILDNEFKSQGYQVPTSLAPSPIAAIAKFFVPALKDSMTSFGQKVTYDTRRMREVLQVNPTPPEKTLIEMVYSMIENNYVKKTSKYRGPSGAAS